MNITGLLRKWAAVLPFFLFIVPFHALAAEPEEVLSINININIDWDYGSGHRTIGTYMVKVTGKVRLTEKEGEWLRYEPVGMRATGKFKQEIIDQNPNSDCFGQVIERIDGFDTVSLTGDNTFLINVNLGHLGKMAAMQYKGNISPGEMFNEKKDSKSDNYSSVLAAGFKITARGGCGNEGYIKEGTIPIALNIFKELTPMGMQGSYTWKSKDDSPWFKIDIGDFHGDRRFNPIKGESTRYRVSWRFGKITPIVQIWYKGKNITEQKSKDVFVGQKVKLEAVVKPQWMSLDKGRWEIEGDIISGWEATEDSAKRIPFEDHEKTEIKFCWIDGNFTGAPMEVKYSGEVDGETVDAKTTINVFKPVATKIEVRPSKNITVGHPVEEADCELFLGKTPATDSPGIKISSELIMPVLPEDNGVERPHLLQYVQRIKEDVLEHHNVAFYHRKNNKWCCDENYPYGGESNRAPHRLMMDDTPGQELGKLTKELHLHNEFDTYLMFIPSANAHDNECSWVPLKVVIWNWAGAVKRIKYQSYDPICDTSTYELLYKERPRPKIQDSSTYPEWSCNIKKNIRKLIGSENYNEEKWKELKDEMEKKKGK